MKIVIIYKNNKDTIKESIESTGGLCKDLILISQESSDGTNEIVNSMGLNFKEESSKKTKAEIKNELLQENENEYLFFLNPNEKIIKSENIKTNKDAIRVNVINDDVLTKEIRISNHKCKWENPVFESIYTKDFHISSFYIKIIKNNKENNKLSIESWEKSKPLSLRPKYYKTMNYLAENNYDRFIAESNNYMHLDRSTDEGTVMMAYYRSLINLYYKDNYLDSIKDIVFCLSCNPQMSEFWCLLGDFYFKLKNIDKSASFYENALIIASKRDFNDEWPVFLSKYKTHPERMIGLCKKYAEDIRSSNKEYRVH